MPSHPPSSEPILLVDDDPDVRTMLTLILQGEGYEVITAADGQEALDRLRSPAPPCLVLLDLMLPVMDGFEFRVRQMEDPKLAPIPVIVFSGGEDVEHKVASLRVAACLSKPVDVDQLLELVRSRVPLSHAGAGRERGDEKH